MRRKVLRPPRTAAAWPFPVSREQPFELCLTYVWRNPPERVSRSTDLPIKINKASDDFIAL